MDIKPNNLMIKSTTATNNNGYSNANDNFQLKLIDFGLSGPYFEQTKLSTAGTPGFCAPELQGFCFQVFVLLFNFFVILFYLILTLIYLLQKKNQR